jgi:hypothetical protein
MVVQDVFNGRLGDEGFIWKRFGKFWVRYDAVG